LRDYKQVTIRLPVKVYETVARFGREYGLTLQDTLLVILLDWVREVEEEG